MTNGNIVSSNVFGKSGATMSSREIAELTGGTHDNVLKTIRALVVRGIVSKNETPYIHPQNGQTYTEFNLNYRDTMVVVSGYSAELRAKIIDRWQELESGLAPVAIDVRNHAQLTTIALQLIEVNRDLEGQIAEAKPRLEALERIAESEGSFCITDAAKTLQVRPKALFMFLRSHRWIYSRAGNTSEVAYQDKLACGFLEHKTTTVTRSDGSEKSVTQVRVTPKGLIRLAKEFPPVASEVAA